MRAVHLACLLRFASKIKSSSRHTTCDHLKCRAIEIIEASDFTGLGLRRAVGVRGEGTYRQDRANRHLKPRGAGGMAAAFAPIASFILGLRYQDIPSDVSHMARRCLVDLLTTWASGTGHFPFVLLC